MVFDSPCDADLDSMPSFDGGRRRFCSDCMRSVHNLSAMTRSEARAFVQDNPGACMSYTRGADGRLIFKRAPAPLIPSARLSRRPASMLAAPLMALAAYTLAEEPAADTLDEAVVAIERDAVPVSFAPYVAVPDLPDEPIPCDFAEDEDEVKPKRKPNNESVDETGVLPAIGNPGHYAGGIGIQDIGIGSGFEGYGSTVAVQSIDVRGTEQGPIETKIAAEVDTFRTCVDEGNFDRGTGELVLRFVIDATGEVLGSKARFEGGDATPCVARALRKLSFPEPVSPSASIEVRLRVS